MLRNYYINREWILSATARSIYRVAAILSLGMIFGLVAARLMGGVPLRFLLMAKMLLFAGVVGTATTAVAMEYFLFGFDTSSARKKALWFCVMLVPPFGPALYCFVVYSRSVATAADANRVESHA
jgi:hypothetical protein